MTVASMRRSELGERAASAANTRAQTPAAAQRLKRLWAVVRGP
jgi:hypothetical protein